MEKIFKIMSKVLLALAITAFSASILMPGITHDVADIAYFAQLSLVYIIVICAIVGAILIYSTNNTAQRIGHGFTISAFIVGIANALMFISAESQTPTNSNSSTTITSPAAIVMIVAIALLVVYYLFQFILLVFRKNAPETNSPNEDLRIVRIKEWKQILDEGIITQEEYEEKRVQILGIKPKQSK